MPKMVNGIDFLINELPHVERLKTKSKSFVFKKGNFQCPAGCTNVNGRGGERQKDRMVGRKEDIEDRARGLFPCTRGDVKR